MQSQSYNPDPGQNNIQSYQQTCFSNSCAAGYADGENQAYTDWSNQNKNPSCPDGHSNSYCSQYLLGYNDELTRSVQQNYNNAPQSNGPNYTDICHALQPVLIQSCGQLVSPDGSLTASGNQALTCIKNGIALGGGAALLGIPLPIVLKGLSILAAPTGCGGIVDMSGFNSLSNIGSLGSLLNSLP
jgi:hypothetical protein